MVELPGCMGWDLSQFTYFTLTDIETRDEVKNTPVNIAARLGHDR